MRERKAYRRLAFYPKQKASFFFLILLLRHEPVNPFIFVLFPSFFSFWIVVYWFIVAMHCSPCMYVSTGRITVLWSWQDSCYNMSSDTFHSTEICSPPSLPSSSSFCHHTTASTLYSRSFALRYQDVLYCSINKQNLKTLARITCLLRDLSLFYLHPCHFIIKLAIAVSWCFSFPHRYVNTQQELTNIEDCFLTNDWSFLFKAKS